MKIEVKGAIIADGDQWIYDWFGVPATSANKVNKLLNQAQAGEEIEVLINSGGGSVFAGSEIYTTLKSYQGKVTGKVTGIAGSAASVIAMGCKELQISPTAQIMIHNASGGFEGDYNDMELGADILKSINSSIANAYEIKTGKSHAELLKMMNNETWLNAQRAVELGFADKVMFKDETQFTNEITDKNGLLPKAVLDKMRAEFQGKINTDEITNVATSDTGDNLRAEEEKVKLAKAKLDLLITI